MELKVQPFVISLQHATAQIVPKQAKGRPLLFANWSLILFFIVMAFKKITAFKAMEAYAKKHYASFGFPKPPSRQTLMRRFGEMSECLKKLMPALTEQAIELDLIDRKRFGFCDKSIFTAFRGYVWHKKHRLQNAVPSKHIDTAASWAKSAYHDWRYGYGLIIVSSANRFPMNACVETASYKEVHVLPDLLKPLAAWLFVVVGDKAYHNIRGITNIYKSLKIIVLSPCAFVHESRENRWYNRLWNDLSTVLQTLYFERKKSIEPVFSLIKELFDLKWNTPLPYKSKEKVEPYLLLLTVSIQLMMIQNNAKGQPLGSAKDFRSLFL